MRKYAASLLAMVVLAAAGCSTEPQDPNKVAQASEPKNCVETTGSNLCRKAGSGDAKTVSTESFENGARTFKGMKTN